MPMTLNFIHDLALRTKEHFLEHVKDINGSHDDANRGDACEPDSTKRGERAARHTSSPGAKQNDKLTHETIQARQTHGGKRDDQHDGPKDGSDLPQASIDFKLTRMRLFVDHANEKEQGTRAQAVIDHLQDGACNPLRIQGEQPEHHKTKM